MAGSGSTTGESGAGGPARGRRTPLNRDRVLRAAVALADEVGVAGLTMRRLAERLEVVPMALYKHVADKDALLDGVVDVVIAEVEAPDPTADWQDAARQRVLSMRGAVRRHPWLRQVVESRTRRTATVLQHMDAVTGTFLAGGLSADLTHHVMHALGNRIWGFSPELFDEPPGQDPAPVTPEAQQALAAAFAERYPNILQVAVAATAGDLAGVGQGCDEDFEFAFALDLLLDGARRLHEQGWRSPARRT